MAMKDIRDDFEINDGRKKLWEVELNILDKVEKTCNENNLNYFLIGGAAIGAVRHNGFIPWDDDIDIGMLRADFEKFVDIAKKDFYGYNIQYGISENYEKSSFLRIRDPKTTAMIRSQMRLDNYTHGIYIEIYPFDEVPRNKMLRLFNRMQSSFYKIELDHRIANIEPSGKNKIIRLILKNMSDNELWCKWNKVCQKYNGKGMEYVDTPAIPMYAKKGVYLYKIEDVVFCEKVPFEDRTVRIAVGNDKCLRISFGDYMEVPPVEEIGKKHIESVFFDPFTPYEYYADLSIPKRYFNGEYSLSPIYGGIKNGKD